jgi:redox-sensitive bicupin YhaK (pirin superfamily)
MTFTELNVWDLRLNAGGRCVLDLPDGHNSVLVVLSGQLEVEPGQKLSESDMAVLSAAGSGVTLRAEGEVSLLALSGVPIDEPVVGYGPFVMNTRDEIVTAFNDLQAGRFGQLV